MLSPDWNVTIRQLLIEFSGTLRPVRRVFRQTTEDNLFELAWHLIFKVRLRKLRLLGKMSGNDSRQAPFKNGFAGQKPMGDAPAGRPYLSDTHPSDNFRPYEKTPITYWLPKQGHFEISLVDEDSPFTIISGQGKRGLNQFRWDLVVETVESPQPYFINYKKHLKPGQYQIRLKTADGNPPERVLTVRDQ